MRNETWSKAVTTKEISGLRIPTIPVGTEFEVLTDIKDDDRLSFKYGELGHASCRGIPIHSIWLTEFNLIKKAE